MGPKPHELVYASTKPTKVNLITVALPGSPLTTTSTSSAVVVAPVNPVIPLTPLQPKTPLKPVAFTAIAMPSVYESVSPSSPISVSYTHLTLPTIYSV